MAGISLSNVETLGFWSPMYLIIRSKWKFLDKLVDVSKFLAYDFYKRLSDVKILPDILQSLLYMFVIAIFSTDYYWLWRGENRRSACTCTYKVSSICYIFVSFMECNLYIYQEVIEYTASV